LVKADLDAILERDALAGALGIRNESRGITIHDAGSNEPSEVNNFQHEMEVVNPHAINSAPLPRRRMKVGSAVNKTPRAGTAINTMKETASSPNDIILKGLPAKKVTKKSKAPKQN
jgi:hypothetical protein